MKYKSQVPHITDIDTVFSKSKSNQARQRGILRQVECDKDAHFIPTLQESIMRRSQDDFKSGIFIDGKKLTNLRYANDSTLTRDKNREEQI